MDYICTNPHMIAQERWQLTATLCIDFDGLAALSPRRV